MDNTFGMQLTDFQPITTKLVTPSKIQMPFGSPSRRTKGVRMFQRVGCKRRVANGEGAVRSARGGRAPHR